MGSCVSVPYMIKKTEDKYLKQSNDIYKLLILGSLGSGKSTLFKQLCYIYGHGFQNTEDRTSFKCHIYSQIVEQMKLIIECVEYLPGELPIEYGHLHLSEAGQRAADYISNLPNDSDVNDIVADNVEILWRENAVKEIFDNRAFLSIADSNAYFFNEVRRIATQSYIPNDKDILLVHYRTTGVIEQRFDIKGTTFNIFDVGGARSERKKWINCFEHVSAVLFITSLSGYDENMFEDESANVMIDSLNLFEEICNNRWFIQTSIILFFNKRDLFIEKIKEVPLSRCFINFEGENTYENCIDFIHDQFGERNNNPSQNPVYSHIICATDKAEFEIIFGDVQHIIIMNSKFFHKNVLF